MTAGTAAGAADAPGDVPPGGPATLLEIHTTVGHAADAERLADAAVTQRLAACVHLAPVRSVYRWAGQVQHDDEVALVFKTTEEAAPRLRALILAGHPYELPALYTLRVQEASPAYRDWVADSTSAD